MSEDAPASVATGRGGAIAAQDSAPGNYGATAEDIIAKVQRGRDTLHQINSTTDH